MDIKNIIKRMMALIAIVVIATAAAMAQTATPKQNDKGKWGIMDSNGKWVLKADYTAIEPMGGEYYRVQKDDKWGVYDNEGGKVLDCKYSTIYKAGEENMSFVAQEKDKPEKWVVVKWEKIRYSGSWKKKDLKEVSYKDFGDGITLLTGTIDNGFSVGEDRRYEPTGFLMKDNICISPVLSAVQLRGNFFLCMTFDVSRWETRSNCVYDLSTGELIAAYAQVVEKDSLIFFGGEYAITADGRLCKVGEVNQNVVMLAASDGKKGLLDLDANLVFPVEYDDIVDGKCGDFVFVGKDGMWGIYSYNNKLNTGLIYPAKECPFKVEKLDGPIVVTSKGKAGLLDIHGNEIVKCEYDTVYIGTISDRYMLKKTGNMSMYLTAEKKIVSLGNYDSFEYITGTTGYYRVSQNGKFGVLNESGTLVVPCKYSKIENAFITDGGDIDDGFHVWDMNGLVGIVRVINGQGKEILPCGSGYEIVEYEPYGIIVRKNGKQGCIKLNGAVFCKTAYDGHINGMKRVGFVKNSASSNDVTVDIYDYNGKFLSTVNVGNDYLDQRWFVQKYLM